MNANDRRKFLAGAGAVSALAASGLVGRAVQAAMGPNDKSASATVAAASTTRWPNRRSSRARRRT
jgi:hypothetical protein